MRLHYQYTAFPGFPDVTEYSRRRARSAVTLSLLFAAVLFLGVAFLLAPAVFGYVAPIAMISTGVGGIVYLSTGYEKKTQQTIEEMINVHRAAQKAQEDSIKKYADGAVQIQNEALRARMELFLNSKRPEA